MEAYFEEKLVNFFFATRRRARYHVRLFLILWTGSVLSWAPSQAWAAPDPPVLGSIQAHEALWAEYVRQQEEWTRQRLEQSSQKQTSLQKERELLSSFSILSNRVDELKAKQNRAPKLVKGEFETTQKFSARQRESLAPIAEELRKTQNQLAKAQRALDDFYTQQRSHAKPANAGAQNFSLPPHSDCLFIPVTMKMYDADHGRIPAFEAWPEYALTKEQGELLYYQMEGPIGGISVDVETAKKLRAASDENRLLAFFAMDPVTIEFVPEKVEYIPGTPAKKASETENRLVALAGGLLVSMFGGDGAQAMGQGLASQEINHPDSLFSSSTPATEKRTLVKLIRIGWQPKAKVLRLCRYDHETSKMTQIWPAP